jgi:transposase
MPPAYVKPYVKRQKNDVADAEAICEAVTRANMRFVETKTAEQQSCLMLHRTRHLFIRQQTAVSRISFTLCFTLAFGAGTADLSFAWASTLPDSMKTGATTHNSPISRFGKRTTALLHIN